MYGGKVTLYSAILSAEAKKIKEKSCNHGLCSHDEWLNGKNKQRHCI